MSTEKTKILRWLSVSLLSMALCSCGLLGLAEPFQNAARDKMERENALPKGATASSGSLRVRAWKPLVNLGDKGGFLRLREPSSAASINSYFVTEYAIAPGPQSQLQKLWDMGKGKAQFMDTKTMTIQGKSATIRYMQISDSKGSRRLAYTWLPINGQGCTITCLGNFPPWVTPSSESVRAFMKELCRCAESVSVAKH